MPFCLILKKVHFDDAMENFPIYCTGAFMSAFSSIFFWPDKGILWGHGDSGNALGIQLLGFTVVSFWMLVLCWLYFFGLKRCRILRMRRAQEILGQDAVDSAKYKGLDVTGILEQIDKNYPA